MEYCFYIYKIIKKNYDKILMRGKNLKEKVHNDSNIVCVRKKNKFWVNNYQKTLRITDCLCFIQTYYNE